MEILALEQMREGVFADGTKFEDVQAAIQAAWLAESYQLAGEIAIRYGLWDFLCLCCAKPCESTVDKQLINAKSVEVGGVQHRITRPVVALNAKMHVCTACLQRRIEEDNGHPTYTIAARALGRCSVSQDVEELAMNAAGWKREP